MRRITRLSALEGYRLSVEFDDGAIGTVDLEGELFGPVFTPLRNHALFAQVHLDEFGVPSWPGGADIAPDAIYARLTGQPIQRQGDRGTGHSEPRKPL